MDVTRKALGSWAETLATAVFGPEQPPVNQIQLQVDLERFAGVFLGRLNQASESLTPNSLTREVSTQALRQLLNYASAAVEIAAGRFPEVNLLDMLVFMELCGGAVTEHWVPAVFGEAGRPLSNAFSASTADLRQLATGVLRAEQLDEVHQLAQAWRRKNPGLHRVEWVRLFDFSETTGRLASEHEHGARGLLSSLKAATQAADQGLLLAERAAFLAQRMPFLVRAHARLGAQEALGDALLALEHTEALRPLLGEATTLAARAAQATTDAHALVERLGPLVEPQGAVQQTLDRVERTLIGAERALSSSNHLADLSLRLLQDVRAANVGRLLFQLAALGAVLVTLFWGGYVVAHRLTRDGSAAPEQTPRQAVHR